MNIHRRLSASIGKRQQFFHWKAPGAGGGIANSVTVEGTSESLLRGKPPTRCPTRCLPAEIRRFRNLLSHFRNAIPLTVRLYDPIRFCTTKTDRQLFLWWDVDFASPRWPNEESPRSSAFYSLRTGGRGVTPDFFSSPKRYALSSGMWLTELIIGLFLRTILPIHFNGKNRPFWSLWPIALE